MRQKQISSNRTEAFFLMQGACSTSRARRGGEVPFGLNAKVGSWLVHHGHTLVEFLSAGSEEMIAEGEDTG